MFEDELHYDQNVSGNMSYGQIGGLSGISAQDLFLWFPVKEIRVDVPSSRLIYFDVVLFRSNFRCQVLKYPGSIWRLRIRLLLRLTVHVERKCRSTASQRSNCRFIDNCVSGGVVGVGGGGCVRIKNIKILRKT
ncbi:hypothetical protein HanPI659440_Chr16g0625591 [Helianthus annuus]|nr:hypothetical protein HanPI659440_Chr16g0625591 [Helianthus annuus]